MSAVEILSNLFFIRRGYLNGNHFVYRSASPILIDTGYKGDFDTTERLIAGIGVDPRRTSLIVTTHSHCDHIGGNRIIQEASGCEVAMHRIGKHFMDTRDDWSTWRRYFAQEADFFDCTRSLEDSEVLCIGPHEFEVMYTPGHSADGIVLFNKRERLLISSDTLWEHDMAVMTVRVEGSRTLFSMLESLDRIAGLDVKTVCPGHGDIFTDYRGAVERTRNRVERFLKDPEAVGSDLIKKIIVYTLMMRRHIEEEAFLPYLMTTPWFPETVNYYFNGDYATVYRETMEGFISRGVVVRSNGWLSTTVQP